ncbi:WD repeat-containing protein 97 isoform X2 [Erythrolamprus reginae]|uniref:WD repeat-containing protein 97 isoform X2 n=1 Tax=Erythrolamprus reginae TaxID=121349 RepID=UPI00396CD065
MVSRIQSVVFRESVSVQPSRESQMSPAPSVRLKSAQSSAIVKGFFPERPSSLSVEKSFQLPKITSGFIPNSVVTQQLHSMDLLVAEKLVQVIGPQKVSESSSKASLMWTFDEDELSEEEPVLVGLETPSKTPSKPWITPAKEDALSIKKTVSGVFLTQLDESQYAEPQPTVPVFAMPFVDQEWFQNLFPEGIRPEMPLKVLVRKLQESLVTCDFQTKTEVLSAITYLKDQLEDRTKRWIQSTLIELLNQEGTPPIVEDTDQERFILAALRVLLHLDRDSLDLMVELMSCYVMASPSARAVFKDMFKELGLQDPHNFFFKEMNSWVVGMEDSKKTARKLSSQWLDEMIRIFKEHRARQSEEEAVSGKGPAVDTGPKPQERKKPEKTPKKPRKLVGKPAKAAHKEETESEEEAQGKASFEDKQPVRPLDAIHYFMEQQLKKELAKVEKAAPPKAESPRDTVLALPHIQKRTKAILRLGETNAMLRKRISERFYFPFIFPRNLMKGFVPFVKLPLPKITLQPFPSRSKKPEPPRTLAARQQLVHKYFIPKLSYTDSYP